MSQLRSQGLFPPRPPSQGKDPGNEVANVDKPLTVVMKRN